MAIFEETILALDRVFINNGQSGQLRHDGITLPFSEMEMTAPPFPDPFPCVTIKYWPNGKG